MIVAALPRRKRVVIFLLDMSEFCDYVAAHVLKLDEAAAVDSFDALVEANVFLLHEPLVVIIVFGDDIRDVMCRVGRGGYKC